MRHLLRPILALVVATLATATAHAAPADTKTKTAPAKPARVLIIGIDGLRRDAVRQLLQEKRLPAIASIAAQGTTYWNMEAGGALKTRTQQPTISSPGWTTILTGVFCDKHNLPNNKFAEPRFEQYPHLYKYIHDARPELVLSSISTWHPINTKMIALSDPALKSACINSKGEKGSDIDAITRDNTVDVLAKQNPDVVFIQFDNVDHTGHATGFGPANPEYVAVLEKTDGYIADILKTLRARPAYPTENWLVILATDHGGKEKKHGGQSPEEREILAIFAGSTFAKNKTDNTLLYQDVFTPTILKHLGIPISPAWGLESPPLN